MLLVNCPHCGKSLYVPNAGWKRIIDLYTSEQKAGRVSESSVIHIDIDTEYELQSLGSWEIGERLASNIMMNGVRNAFITMFGHQVQWGADKLEIK